MLHRSKGTNRFIAITIAILMVLSMLAGCGKDTGGAAGENGGQPDGADVSGLGQDAPDGTGAAGGQGQTAENGQGRSYKDVAMGRYTETAIDLSDKMGINTEVFDLKKMNDGSLVLIGAEKEPLQSKDGGGTWEFMKADWFGEIAGNYRLDGKVTPDGAYGYIYNIGKGGELDTRVLLVSPDGEKRIVEADLSEEEYYLRHIWLKEDGRVFFSGFGDTIYEVMDDGSVKAFLTVEEGVPELVTFVGEIMVMDSSDYDAPLLYDLEKKEYVEDAVLTDFVKEYYKERHSSTTNTYKLFLFPGEEDVIYLAGQQGLHRHVIGGGAIEQVIDGTLSSFNDPSNMIASMIMTENEEFLVYYSNGKLVRFTYNPDVPSIPQHSLNVYSLAENDLIRQAMTAYQNANPDVYVKYSIGLGDDSVTKEDAIKKVNTQIMAGEGPDVLVLDDMPMQSYIEKGLLADMNPLIAEMGGNTVFFKNILDACQTEGKQYIVPCKFLIPIIGGDAAYLGKVRGLTDLADVAEQMRKEMPDKAIMQYYLESVLLKHFTPTCENAWIKKDGTLDTAKLSEFLVQVKRIYDVQNHGGDEEEAKRRIDIETERTKVYHTSDRNDGSWAIDYTQSIDIVGYAGGRQQIMSGMEATLYSYTYVTSLKRMEGIGDLFLTPFEGQSGKVFKADTLVGVVASSPNISMAEEFVKVLLGADMQSNMEGAGGFAVNREGFEASCHNQYAEEVGEGNSYGSIGSSNSDGTIFSMDLYWIDKEEKAELVGWIEQMNVAYIPDSVVEDAVGEEGSLYLRGEQSLEKAVDEIAKKVSIYLAE